MSREMTNDFTTRPAGEHEAQLTKRLGEVIRERDRYREDLKTATAEIGTLRAHLKLAMEGFDE